MQSVGDYEYGQSDLIGHGAFALVFKGREKIVSTYIYCMCDHTIFQILIIYHFARPILLSPSNIVLYVVLCISV